MRKRAATDLENVFYINKNSYLFDGEGVIAFSGITSQEKVCEPNVRKKKDLTW